MQKIPELSVFFPFWNEEENIKKVVQKGVRVVSKLAQKWEILVIDDGSSDKTPQIAKELCQKNKNLRFISHSPNRGYGAALKEGLTKSKYKLVAFTDGDDQFDIAEIEKLLEKISTNDLVIGYRKKRNDSLVRHLLMLFLKVYDFILFGFHFKDIDCGFKLFKKEAINKILPLKSEGAMITTEILAKARKAKLKIAQVGVHHYPRRYGSQSGANLRVLIRALRESLALWFDLHKS